MPHITGTGVSPDSFWRLCRGVFRRGASEQARRGSRDPDQAHSSWLGTGQPTFRQVFTSQFIPDGTREQHQWFNDLERMSASPENAVAIVEALYQLDVSAEAASLSVPTLVMHSRNDARVPFEEGRRAGGANPVGSFRSTGKQKSRPAAR